MENNVYDSRNINVNTKKRKSRKVNFRFFIFCILIIILIISFILKYKEYILDKLNSYVETYNQGDKESTSSKELLTWKFDEETGFPTLSF